MCEQSGIPIQNKAPPLVACFLSPLHRGCPSKIKNKLSSMPGNWKHNPGAMATSGSSGSGCWQEGVGESSHGTGLGMSQGPELLLMGVSTNSRGPPGSGSLQQVKIQLLEHKKFGYDGKRSCRSRMDGPENRESENVPVAVRWSSLLRGSRGSYEISEEKKKATTNLVLSMSGGRGPLQEGKYLLWSTTLAAPDMSPELL